MFFSRSLVLPQDRAEMPPFFGRLFFFLAVRLPGVMRRLEKTNSTKKTPDNLVERRKHRTRLRACTTNSTLTQGTDKVFTILLLRNMPFNTPPRNKSPRSFSTTKPRISAFKLLGSFRCFERPYVVFFKASASFAREAECVRCPKMYLV